MKELVKKIMLENLSSTQKLIEESINLRFLTNGAESPNKRNWAYDFYLKPLILKYVDWLYHSDELSNFTYGLRNDHHLIGWASAVTGQSLNIVQKYLDEIYSDQWLLQQLNAKRISLGSDITRQSSSRDLYGRRVGWYVIARLLKPALIVETGVDKGLGSSILSRAIMNNAEEGFPGRYLGTDINPRAGELLPESLKSFGEIVIGDSITTLRGINVPINLFINDSDHSAEYERSEYLVIKDKLAGGAVVLGDNSHVTRELFSFAVAHEMNFLHFQEQPENHWYPGAGIGAAFFKPI